MAKKWSWNGQESPFREGNIELTSQGWEWRRLSENWEKICPTWRKPQGKDSEAGKDLPCSRNIKEAIVTGKEKSLICFKQGGTTSDLHFKMVTGDFVEDENELGCGSRAQSGGYLQQSTSDIINRRIWGPLNFPRSVQVRIVLRKHCLLS